MEPLSQPDYLDGEVVHVGVESEPVTVHLRENGTIHRCIANTGTAERLASLLNGPLVRAFGIATWVRNESGLWQLLTFSIQDFIPLEHKTVSEAVAQLDNVPSPLWPRNAAGDLEFGSIHENDSRR